MNKLLIPFLTFTIYLLPFNIVPAMAYVAASTNYRLERDSINFAGKKSSSASFGVEDTLGEVGTGRLLSTNYILQAGYQQPNSYVSITSPADVSLTPAILKFGGGIATGEVIWKVTTDSPGGYTLSLQAAAGPALTSGVNSFADYTPAGVNPDYTWSVGAGAAEFGFTPEGPDVSSTYKDNGTNCNSGTNDTVSTCWDAFSTSAKIVARSTSSNDGLGGTNTTIRLQAEAGASALPAAGAYSALITATAIAL